MSPPVPFTLSDAERNILYSAVMAADFFDRPTDLGVGQEPSNNFELEVRNPGRRHTVRWTVESNWFQSDDGRPVRVLAQTIFEVLENHFGPPGDGCNGGPPIVR